MVAIGKDEPELLDLFKGAPFQALAPKQKMQLFNYIKAKLA